MKPIGPLLCFDLGNVLVRLGPAIDAYAREDCRADLASLLQRYSLGLVTTKAFFGTLQGFMVWPMALHELQEAFVHARLPGLHDGSETLIQDLSSFGLELAVLSNINEAHWQHLQRFKALRHFRHTFLSFQIGIKKPSNAIYRLVELRTGRCGRDIIFFDDRKENVLSARRCGWNASLVPPENAIVHIRKSLACLGLL